MAFQGSAFQNDAFQVGDDAALFLVPSSSAARVALIAAAWQELEKPPNNPLWNEYYLPRNLNPSLTAVPVKPPDRVSVIVLDAWQAHPTDPLWDKYYLPRNLNPSLTAVPVDQPTLGAMFITWSEPDSPAQAARPSALTMPAAVSGAVGWPWLASVIGAWAQVLPAAIAARLLPGQSVDNPPRLRILAPWPDVAPAAPQQPRPLVPIAGRTDEPPYTGRTPLTGILAAWNAAADPLPAGNEKILVGVQVDNPPGLAGMFITWSEPDSPAQAARPSALTTPPAVSTYVAVGWPWLSSIIGAWAQVTPAAITARLLPGQSVDNPPRLRILALWSDLAPATPQQPRLLVPIAGRTDEPPYTGRTPLTGILAAWNAAPDPLPTGNKQGIVGVRVDNPIFGPNAAINAILRAHEPIVYPPTLPRSLPGQSVDRPTPTQSRSLGYGIYISWLPMDPAPTQARRLSPVPDQPPLPARRQPAWIELQLALPQRAPSLVPIPPPVVSIKIPSGWPWLETVIRAWQPVAPQAPFLGPLSPNILWRIDSDRERTLRNALFRRRILANAGGRLRVLKNALFRRRTLP